MIELEKKKLIGIKVTYIYLGELKPHNLAVRGYNPTVDQLTGKSSIRAINEVDKIDFERI